ncbi:MAG: DNA-deoxyinosine glycosylase [Gammaproteobacteria bacterium]|nr:DNA-deoxyinosine glycosylase [Gammaproteobacteria bacterium]
MSDAAVGFAPVADAAARVLILGTLPGRVSLARREYYAQHRNAFWPIMGVLYGAGPEIPYPQRLQRLCAARVALWDVCAAATRPGSLDSAIDPRSVVPNDFSAFFAAHPRIAILCFNGAAAESMFRRLVSPTLGAAPSRFELRRLPSTSAANASLCHERKLAAWTVGLQWGRPP